MKEETIVQFVCFITDLETEEFGTEWKGYTETLKATKTKTILYRQTAGENIYRYVSKFEWPESDFQFTFMKERKSGRFSESKVRALQMGGYITIEQHENYAARSTDTTIIAFIHHNETDISYYKQLPSYSQLNIHQAYYENCNYGHVLEFIVPAKDTDALLLSLEKRPGVHVAVYKIAVKNKVRRLESSI